MDIVQRPPRRHWCGGRRAWNRYRATGDWREVEHWIIIHWFELATLALLCLNLWFIVTVLSVLRSVNYWLMFFARWARNDTTSQSEVD